MTDLPNGRQTVITDEDVLNTTDVLCKVLRKQRIWNHRIADDLFQEVYIALFRARDRYDPGKASWLTYSYIIAKGAARDFFRQAPLNGEDENGRIESLDQISYEPARDSNVHTPLSWELNKYKLKERKILVLLMAGYSQREIASYLSTDATYVSQLIADLRIKSSPLYSSPHTDSRLMKQAA